MAGEPHRQQTGEQTEECEITLSFEGDAPKPRSDAEAVEYDEFGLPVRKLERAQYYYDDDSSIDERPPSTPATSKPIEPAGAKSKSPSPSARAPSPTTAPAHTPVPSSLANDGTATSNHRRTDSLQSLTEGDRKDNEVKMFSEDPKDPHMPVGQNTVSEWSHQQIVPRGGRAEETEKAQERKEEEVEDEWQTMPAYASYDMYDDDGRLIARAHDDSEEEEAGYGAAKGYTRVYDDEDAESVTSMDENTKYLFQENESDEAARNPLDQMKATKELLTEGQRIAYVGVCRLALIEMLRDMQKLTVSGRTAKKRLQVATESMRMWSQKIMVRLYTHMELSPPEQIMIEQLAEHGVLPSDLTPSLMQNARVINPMAFQPTSFSTPTSSRPGSIYSSPGSPMRGSQASLSSASISTALPEYQETELTGDTKTPAQLPQTKMLDIDLRWTVLCDLFLVLIADSIYDARARVLLERVGVMFDVSWLDICKFEKRVTNALEMQESGEQNWAEQNHLDVRAKQARTKRFMMLGLATVGGGLVIGLSGGLLAPVIGAGLAAGFATMGVAGTSGFLVGTGGTALIASSAAVSGSYIGGKAGFNRMKSVGTFEFKPLHNAKRLNLIITVSGWMNGKIDDVRLPFSTVDPIMGDLFSIYWEPEMLQSMGKTISILATEALTQTLQQVLGNTILISLMAAMQLPLVLTKLAYLIDNPWSVSLERAAAAGLILADTLVHRNLGMRPVTLVGYSLGARVIYFCLRELARIGATGLVQNVYLFGSPIVAKPDEYSQACSVVSGRFVNGYATNDWILGYLFRATSGGIGRIAGLAPVNIPGVENVDVTELVNGHMAYRSAMPKLLRRVGWEVISDEFSEIEDPDPENHQQRQRELINELEEARKEMEAGNRKSKWTFFGRNKDPAKKKDWETYKPNTEDEKNETSHTANGAPDDPNVLFDIDAIRAEIELSMQKGYDNDNTEITIKEIESTLPKLRISLEENNLISMEGDDVPPSYDSLRHTKSFEHRFSHNPTASGYNQSYNQEYKSRGYSSFELPDDYNGRGDDDIKLEFDMEPEPRRPELRASQTMPADYGTNAYSSSTNGHGSSSAGGYGGHTYGRNVWADDDDDEFAPKDDGDLKMTFA